MSDFELTFDTKSFDNSINKMFSQLTLVPQKAKDAFSKVGQYFSNSFSTRKDAVEKQAKVEKNYSGGAMDMVSGLTKRVVGLAVAYFGLHAILSRLPEVGQTFSIAGDIMMRNFLWPLRQELMPYLQKILDWTRDHRAMFVRWGSVLVNVFRMVKGWVETLINSFKTMYNAFMKSWEGFFGKSKKTWMEWIHVFIFQMTVIVIAIQTLLAPLFEKLGKLFGQLAIYVKGFFEGFLIGIKDVMQPIGDLISLAGELFSSLTGGSDTVSFLYKAFSTLGDFLGTSLISTLEFVVASLQAVFATVKGIAQGITGLVSAMTGDLEGAKQSFKTMSTTFSEGYSKAGATAQRGYDRIGSFQERTKERWSGEAKPMVQPQQVTNNKATTQNVSQHIGEIKITVDDAAKGRQFGADFAAGHMSSMQEIWKKEMLKEQGVTGR